MKRILLLGGSGFIGTRLIESLQKKYEVISTYHTHLPQIPNTKWIKLDASNILQLQEILNSHAPDIIINLITYSQGASHVDACEKNREECTFINTSPTKVIAAHGLKNPAVKYIFFSSSQVFSSGERHKEKDLPAPVNIYGETKLRAENLVRKLSNYAIVRPCVVFGVPLDYQHGNIVTQVYKTLKAGKEFRAYTDMIRSPCYVQDAVAVVEKIIQRDARGIFHVPGETTSMYGFARAVAESLALDTAWLKSATAGKEPPYRARNTSLDSTYTRKRLAIKPTPWTKALAEIKVRLR